MKDQFNANQRAHHCLSVFHSICDEYNRGQLSPDHPNYNPGEMTPQYIRCLQSMTQEAYDLIKFLHAKANDETTKAYMVFCGKLLLRLSYLRAHGRVETDQETAEYFSRFNVTIRDIGESGKVDQGPESCSKS